MKTEESKTHYRKIFKSDHLGSADLEEYLEEGKKLVFTIKNVKQEYGAKVAGRKIDANIAYFTENIKPLVLNATNSKQVRKFTGSAFVEDWNGVIVELYIDNNVKMKGETVDGVRIRSVQPTTEKPELTPDSIKWESAKKAVQEKGATIDTIAKHYVITVENYALLCG